MGRGGRLVGNDGGEYGASKNVRLRRGAKALGGSARPATGPASEDAPHRPERERAGPDDDVDHPTADGARWFSADPKRPRLPKSRRRGGRRVGPRQVSAHTGGARLLRTALVASWECGRLSGRTNGRSPRLSEACEGAGERTGPAWERPGRRPAGVLLGGGGSVGPSVAPWAPRATTGRPISKGPCRRSRSGRASPGGGGTGWRWTGCPSPSRRRRAASRCGRRAFAPPTRATSAE